MPIQVNMFVFPIFPSHISGRGYIIGPVSVSVCLSVSSSQLNRLMYEPKITHGHALDNISERLVGQGPISKAQVAILKNVILGFFM